MGQSSKRRARDYVENLNKAFKEAFTLNDNRSEVKNLGRNNGVGIIGKEQTSRDYVENLNKAFKEAFTLNDNRSEVKNLGRNNGVGIIGKEQTSRDYVENLNKAFKEAFTLNDNRSEVKNLGRNNGVGIIGKEQTSSSEMTSSTTKRRRNRRTRKIRERRVGMEQHVPSKNQQLTSHLVFLKRKLGLVDSSRKSHSFSPPSRKLDFNKQVSVLEIFHKRLRLMDSSSTGSDAMMRLGLPLPAIWNDSKITVTQGDSDKYNEILAIEALNWLSVQPLEKKQRSSLIPEIPDSEQTTSKLTSTLDTEFSKLHV